MSIAHRIAGRRQTRESRAPRATLRRHHFGDRRSHGPCSNASSATAAGSIDASVSLMTLRPSPTADQDVLTAAVFRCRRPPFQNFSLCLLDPNAKDGGCRRSGSPASRRRPLLRTVASSRTLTRSAILDQFAGSSAGRRRVSVAPWQKFDSESPWSKLDSPPHPCGSVAEVRAPSLRGRRFETLPLPVARWQKSGPPCGSAAEVRAPSLRGRSWKPPERCGFVASGRSRSSNFSNGSARAVGRQDAAGVLHVPRRGGVLW